MSDPIELKNHHSGNRVRLKVTHPKITTGDGATHSEWSFDRKSSAHCELSDDGGNKYTYTLKFHSQRRGKTSHEFDPHKFDENLNLDTSEYFNYYRSGTKYETTFVAEYYINNVKQSGPPEKEVNTQKPGGGGG